MIVRFDHCDGFLWHWQLLWYDVLAHSVQSKRIANMAMSSGARKQERIAMRPGGDVPRCDDMRLCDYGCTCKLHAVPIMPHLPAVPAVISSLIHGRCTPLV